MELPIQTFPSESFIETESGNKISRMSVICGSQHIVLGGKSIVETGAVLRGDLRRAIASAGHLVSLAIGKYCIFRENVVLRPPYKLYKGVCSYYPAKIGDHVYMGSGTISEAASIGNCVYIGQNCVIGRFAIIKDCCYIADNSVIPPNAIIPSFSVYSGVPAAFEDDWIDTAQEYMEDFTMEFYAKFRTQ